MDIFRLTYFVSTPHETDKWKSTHRYEVFGSAEAICDLYLHLKKIANIADTIKDLGGVPHFIDMYNKDGLNLNEEFKKHGFMGLRNCNTFK